MANVSKNIYMVVSEDTTMVRFITASSNSTDKAIIGRVLRALKATKQSDQGNAASRRINPSWNAHREAFLNANKFTVIQFKPCFIGEKVPSSLQHQVACLNRSALRKATIVFTETEKDGSAK